MEGFGERAFSLLGPPAALSSARRVFSRSVRTSVFRFRVPRDFRSTVLAPESAIPSRYTRPADATTSLQSGGATVVRRHCFVNVIFPIRPAQPAQVPNLKRHKPEQRTVNKRRVPPPRARNRLPCSAGPARPVGGAGGCGWGAVWVLGWTPPSALDC